MPEDMPKHIAEDMPGRMPEDMPDRMPEDMPDKMSEGMSDRMPEDLPVTKRIDVMVGITRSKVINECGFMHAWMYAWMRGCGYKYVYYIYIYMYMYMCRYILIFSDGFVQKVASYLVLSPISSSSCFSLHAANHSHYLPK